MYIFKPLYQVLEPRPRDYGWQVRGGVVRGFAQRRHVCVPRRSPSLRFVQKMSQGDDYERVSSAYLGKGAHPLQVEGVLKLLVGEHEQPRIDPPGGQLLPIKLDGENPRIEAKSGLLLRDRASGVLQRLSGAKKTILPQQKECRVPSLPW